MSMGGLDRVVVGLALMGTVACTSCDEPDAAADETAEDSDDASARIQGEFDRPGDAERYMLYDLGDGIGYRPGDVHADADGVYWTQKGGKLFRGLLDGSDEPLRIGTFSSNSQGVRISSDSTHVYWLDGAFLRRWSKADGSTEDIELQWDHTGGNFAHQGAHIYVAMWGCAAITRINKTTLEDDTVYTDVGPTSIGGTTLAFDGETLYCGSWGNIFRFNPWGEPGVKLTGSGSQIEGLVVVGDYVYWIDTPQNGWVGENATVATIPKEGGTATAFVPEAATRGASAMVYAASVNRFFWIQARNVVGFDLETRTYVRLLTDWAQYKIALHDTTLYWTWDRARGRVQHMPVDHGVEETLDAHEVELP